MSNLFDNIQSNAFDIVNKTMGYDATWTPSAGGETKLAVVLLNKPTQKDKISDQEYEIITPKAEYKEGDFDGLFESVTSGVNEIITINGIDYNVYEANRRFDGKTIIITIQER